MATYHELEQRRIELQNLNTQIEQRYAGMIEGGRFTGSQADRASLEAQRRALAERERQIIEQQRKARRAQEQLRVIERMKGKTGMYAPLVRIQERKTEQAAKAGAEATEAYNRSVEDFNRKTQQVYESYKSDVEGLTTQGESFNRQVSEYNHQLEDEYNRQVQRQQDFGEYLQKVAEGRDVPQVVDISFSNRPGTNEPVFTYQATSDIATPGKSVTISGSAYLSALGPTDFEGFKKWAIEGAKRNLGLGPEDIIRIEGKTIQESAFTPEEISAAKQVFAVRPVALEQYRREQELEQDRLKTGWEFAQKDAARLQSLYDQIATLAPTKQAEALKEQLKGSYAKEVVEGMRWEVGGVTFSRPEMAEKYAGQLSEVASKQQAERVMQAEKAGKIPLFDPVTGEPNVMYTSKALPEDTGIPLIINTSMGRVLNPQVKDILKAYQRQDLLSEYVPAIQEQERGYASRALAFPGATKDITVAAEKLLVPGLLVKQVAKIFTDLTGTEKEKKIADEELQIARGQYYEQQKVDVGTYGEPLAVMKGTVETIPVTAWGLGSVAGGAVTLTKAALIKGSEKLLLNHNTAVKLLGTSLSLGSRAIEPVVGAAFVGGAVYETLEAERRGGTGEALGTVAMYIEGFPFAISGYKAGKGAAERGIDILAVRGKSYVPKEQIMAPEVLSGEKQFYMTKAGDTVAQVMGRFYDTKYGLPGETKGVARMWHGTAQPISPEVPLRSLSEMRPSDVPGMYGSSALSKWFLRIGSPENPKTPELPLIEKLKFWLLGSQDVFPKGARITLKGIKRLPPDVRYSIEGAREFLGIKDKPGPAAKGYAYLTSLLESKVRQGRAAEEEVVLSPKTFLEKTSEKYYTEIEGRKVPLEERLALGGSEETIKPETKRGKLTTIEELYKESIEYRRGRQYTIKTTGVASVNRRLDELKRRVLDTSDLYRSGRSQDTTTGRRDSTELRRLYNEYVRPVERRAAPERGRRAEYRLQPIERRAPLPKRRVSPDEYRRIIDRYEEPRVEYPRTPPYRLDRTTARMPPYEPLYKPPARTPQYKPRRTTASTPTRIPPRTPKQFEDAIDHASKKRKGRYKWDIENPVPTFESLFGG